MAKPSIPIPGALDLRVLQQAIGNIAERLRQLDAQAATLTSYATNSKTASSLTILNQKIAELTERINDLDAAVAAIGEDAYLQAPPPESLAPALARLDAVEQGSWL